MCVLYTGGILFILFTKCITCILFTECITCILFTECILCILYTECILCILFTECIYCVICTMSEYWYTSILHGVCCTRTQCVCCTRVVYSGFFCWLGECHVNFYILYICIFSTFIVYGELPINRKHYCESQSEFQPHTAI